MQVLREVGKAMVEQRPRGQILIQLNQAIEIGTGYGPIRVFGSPF
jgi:hypothetical protein